MSKPDPITLQCYSTCKSCMRCADKGSKAACEHCAGRPDPQHKRDPDDIDDRCRCKEGILQYRTKNGKLLVAKIPNDPFASKVLDTKETQDESDYTAMLQQMRQRTGDPNWDPVRFENGLSSAEWYDRYKSGRA